MEGETDESYEKRYNFFIESINTNGNYAGDFEISAASLILDKEIIIYRKGYTNFELPISIF